MSFSNQRFYNHTRESSIAYLNSFIGSSNLFLDIRLADIQQMVGTITAYRSKQHQNVDIGLLIGDKNNWGKGIGLDAWSTLLDYMLNDCKLRKVTAGSMACNIGMIKIMERSGMNLEAVLSQQELLDRVPQDSLKYAKFFNS